MLGQQMPKLSAGPLGKRAQEAGVLARVGRQDQPALAPAASRGQVFIFVWKRFDGWQAHCSYYNTVRRFAYQSPVSRIKLDPIFKITQIS